MKIATYNLRSGGRQGQRLHWRRLLDELAPDILLVQETLHPSEYLAPEFYAANARRIYWLAAPNRRWGSAIYVRAGRLRPIDLPRHNGFVVAAEVSGTSWPRRGAPPLLVASLHVPAPYTRPMHELLDDLKALAGRRALVLGGDFNLAVGERHVGERVRADRPWLLRRLRREFNLMSCWQTAHPNQDLAQTLRWTGNPAAPYHCDGIFVPAAWYGCLEECEVLSDARWDEMSDHNPVVAVLEAGPAG
jgi:endonuclease/exonuclease/phosphatase family metal-dependent hydrolase